MANTDKPFGLKPVGTLNGAPWNAAVQEFPIASAYNTAIYNRDPVELVTGGTIELAEAGNVDTLGILMGVQWTGTDGAIHYSQYWPASTATLDSQNAKALVLMANAGVIFEVQHDSDGATPAQADIGTNADLIFTHTGSVTTGSKVELDTSTATTATAQMRILGFAQRPDNEVGNYGVVRVVFNEHFMQTTTGI